MKILWHVSSHGWGHAARQRELIRVYKIKHPDTRITVASNVPLWFWNDSEIDAFIPGSPSPIAVEKDGDVDLHATKVLYQNFTTGLSDSLEAEVSRQLMLNPDLVISDIDPLPVKAAEINSLPALGISNFTWDWIMQELFPAMRTESRLLASMYQHGTYLRLPMGPEYSPFNSTIDLPLLRSGPPGYPEKVKDLLPPGKICLVALRKIPPGINLSVPKGFTTISSLPEPIHSISYNISPAKLMTSGATFSDLVAACDVMVTKPGYGILSQIIAMGKNTVLLTGRNFPEEKYLLADIAGQPGISLLNMNGNSSTRTDIHRIAAQKRYPPAVQNNAETIVDIIHRQY